MNKEAWVERIKSCCVAVHTYNPAFDDIIMALAGILEKRDEAEMEYNGRGDGMVIEMTNKGGHTNTVKNPLIMIWDDLNKSALQHWKELGLTPAGLKKLNEQAFEKKKEDTGGNPLLKVLQQKRE